MTFVIWLCLAFIVGYFGKSKNIGFGWAFFWSLILSPLVGLVIVLFSSKPEEQRLKMIAEIKAKISELEEKEEES